jgi:GNAT superfamily N-acetyltransferase
MIRIRTLQGQDVPAVVSIWNQALTRDPTNTGRFVGDVLGDPDYWPGDDSGFFVAVRDGDPVGFLRAIIRRMGNDRVGIEPDKGWIPVVAVAPGEQKAGLGMALMTAALDWFRRHERKQVWVCGGSGSAPGYLCGGVDLDVYPGAIALFRKAGFRVDREAEAMSREAVDFDADGYARDAWAVGRDVRVETLSPERVDDFMSFLAESFPGDWNTAARGKIRSGRLHEVLIAVAGERVVGYCQWEGEHFGPFGVAEAMRNRRVGAKLFVEAVRRIRQADGRTVWFNWAEADAARFYRRFGLRPTRRFAILVKDL